MQSSTFDVKERRKRIIVFKVGKLWIFKQFFEDKEIFKALLGHYNQDCYRFEFKTIADRNNALKILEQKRLKEKLAFDQVADISFSLWIDCIARDDSFSFFSS